MSIQDEVDRLINERPGRELLHPDYDEEALLLADGIYRSAGATASYMLLTSEGRVIVGLRTRRLLVDQRPSPRELVVGKLGQRRIIC